MLQNFADNNNRLVVLTGAGISAESGIPTFRGPEGFWTIGSRDYRPEEMATYRMFSQNPEEVWQWYLYRIGICRGAGPNDGHRAVAAMENLLGDNFLLITQNVDGLHLKAGNSLEKTYQIHGSIEFIRCGSDCTKEVLPISDKVTVKKKDEPLTAGDVEALKCSKCGSWVRPHVLWFDECYNEEYFKYQSSTEAAMKADMLITVGTSGATNLPMQVGGLVAGNGGFIVDVNPDRNPFSSIAEENGGVFCQGKAGKILTEFVEIIK